MILIQYGDLQASYNGVTWQGVTEHESLFLANLWDEVMLTIGAEHPDTEYAGIDKMIKILDGTIVAGRPRHQGEAGRVE